MEEDQGEEKKGIQQKRNERKKFALAKVLDDEYSMHFYEDFWDALLISNIDNMIDSIERASKTADKLSKRIFWLNLILVILGGLALLVAGYGVFFK